MPNQHLPCETQPADLGDQHRLGADLAGKAEAKEGEWAAESEDLDSWRYLMW